MKTFFSIMFATFVCLSANAEIVPNKNGVKALEEKYEELQSLHAHYSIELRRLTEKLKEEERCLKDLKSENNIQSAVIDSLRNICNQLGKKQSADNKSICRKIDETNSNVQENQNMLQSRTLWAGMVVLLLLVAIFGVAYRLVKRIKLGSTSIDEVRKAQDALQVAQGKMQEESVKLDDKLLELFDRQIANAPKNEGNGKTDHSLALKVADEIVRIELNMSRMDSSIKGYKQLAKAVERIKDNFKANGYEIVDMLGKPYNEGMKVIANFVVDEDLEEGKQIITGITKPQINYNGQMIQAAQITVSQNI